MVYGDGSEFAYCRMYTNAKEVWEGFSKNFYAAVGFSFPAVLVTLGALLGLGDLYPFLVLLLGVGSPLWFGALLLCLALWGARLTQAIHHGMSPWSVFFHPVGCLLFAAIGVNSILWAWTGKGHWKGRRLTTD